MASLPSLVAAAPHSAAVAAAVAVPTARRLIGITLSVFETVAGLTGSPAELEGKSTDWLKHNFVLPRTRDCALSVADWLVAEGRIPADACGPANAFVSHAYDDAFLNVVGALRAWEARQCEAGAPGPFFYYFDLLVVNQHGQDAVVSFEALRDEFGAGVRGAGRTLLVLCWPGLSPLRRAWCIFEIFTTLEAGAGFEVVMAPGNRAQWEGAARRDFAATNEALLRTNAATAEAREPEDLRNIQRVIADRPGGFLRVNKVVTDGLLSAIAGDFVSAPVCGNAYDMFMQRDAQGVWAYLRSDAFQTLATAVECCGGFIGAPPPFVDLIGILRMLSLSIDQEPGAADASLRNALEKNPAACAGPSSIRTTLLEALSESLVAQGKAEDAEPLLAEMASTTRASWGVTRIESARHIAEHARVLRDLRRAHTEIVARYSEALDSAQRAAGDYPFTAVLRNELAAVLEHAGDAPGASDLRLQNQHAIERFAGAPVEPWAIDDWLAFAASLFAQERFGEAEYHLRRVLQACIRLRGPGHANTLHCQALLCSTLRWLADTDGSEHAAGESQHYHRSTQAQILAGALVPACCTALSSAPLPRPDRLLLLGALVEVTCFFEGTCTQLRDAGGVSMLFAELARRGGCKTIAALSCGVLANMAALPAVLPFVATPAVVGAILHTAGRHAAHAGVALQACDALRAVAGAPGGPVLLRERGAEAALAAILCNHWGDGTIRALASETLVAVQLSSAVVSPTGNAHVLLTASATPSARPCGGASAPAVLRAGTGDSDHDAAALALATVEAPAGDAAPREGRLLLSAPVRSAARATELALPAAGAAAAAATSHSDGHGGGRDDGNADDDQLLARALAELALL